MTAPADAKRAGREGLTAARRARRTGSRAATRKRMALWDRIRLFLLFTSPG